MGHTKEYDTWTAVAKHRLEATYKLPDYLLDDMTIDEWREDMRQETLISFRKYFFAYELHNYKIKYPANWWEAFKERFLNFLGVKYITYTIDYDIILPEIKHDRFKNMITFPYVSYIKNDQTQED